MTHMWMLYEMMQQHISTVVANVQLWHQNPCMLVALVHKKINLPNLNRYLSISPEKQSEQQLILLVFMICVASTASNYLTG